MTFNKPNGWMSSFIPWILPALFFMGWFLVSRFEIIPAYLMPSPRQVGEAGVIYAFGTPGEGPYAGRFWMDAWVSCGRVLAGFSLAALFGIPLGVLSGRVDAMQKILSSSINALRAVPGICWLPLAMVWFGIGYKTTLFLVALAAFFPIYINTAVGARQVSPLLFQAGAMMGVRRMNAVFSILLPGAMPSILAGLRLGLGISWAYLVLGELTGVPNGLGAVIMDARMLGRIDIIIVGIVLIALLGRTSDLLLSGVFRLCFKSARRLA
ncbi:binding-protein-dependent transport systems inner membrane component [Desulfatibacillum aliphaticivorans]|uniref:Binding-protein-dependent transport systems inner membrane component n=1 Tax=Desulfatibacillum aliphaticivorans TaxID=218208 RepID=B8FLR9_DESAL|nr:ABC transporter permease [Desulfatibacillum aliphaticivorans]ACL05423.1 binding-protein-dependent transport systems inner membrane component [Desulfatibacillum aliphaticivorans]